MIKVLFVIVVLVNPIMMNAQSTEAVQDTNWQDNFRASATKINDLVHTKLDVKFDYDRSYLYGKAWITLHPHFYPTDSLQLDAKGMDIKQVALVKNGKNTPLKFSYDGLFLNIDLDKAYKAKEDYTVYIDYTAKPDEFQARGSA